MRSLVIRNSVQGMTVVGESMEDSGEGEADHDVEVVERDDSDVGNVKGS